MENWMKTEWVHVTPKKAAEYLAKNDKNRNISPARVEKMVSDMQAGHWVKTHQGIAFNCDGSLRDGQHRLEAIIRSGCAQWLLVTHGIDEAGMRVIDTHRVRTIADVFKIEGGLANKTDVACARAMMAGMRGADYPINYTRLDIIEFVEKHWEALEFARRLNRGPCRNAAVTSVIARAWYTQDRERLEELIEALNNQVVKSEEDGAALTLLKVMATRKQMFAGSTGRKALYAKAESAVRAFLRRQPMTRLYEVESECFPIPDDKNEEDR